MYDSLQMQELPVYIYFIYKMVVEVNLSPKESVYKYWYLITVARVFNVQQSIDWGINMLRYPINVHMYLHLKEA